jgi:hypothetical protein
VYWGNGWLKPKANFMQGSGIKYFGGYLKDFEKQSMRALSEGIARQSAYSKLYLIDAFIF